MITMTTIHNIDEFCKIAHDKGGSCLSRIYKGVDYKLKFQCSEGHIWKAVAKTILNDSWCRKCENRNRIVHDIHHFKDIAKSRGGLCLSSDYHGGKTRLNFQCKCGTRWTAIADGILRGKWCPKCGLKKRSLSVKSLQESITDRGLTIISTEYKNAHTHVVVKCSLGHTFRAKPHNLKINKTNCPVCSRDKQRLNLETIQKVAADRGGRLITTTYTNNRGKMKWECVRKHRWKASTHSVLRGSWCPYCRIWAHEEACRFIFQKLFPGHRFIKQRFDWMRVENGYKLELDGYCEDLQLAFEYNGEQHYKKVDRFHVGKKTLAQRKRYDAIKLKKCKEQGIDLVVIPYTVKMEDMESYIISELIGMKRWCQNHRSQNSRGGDCLDKDRQCCEKSVTVTE